MNLHAIAELLGEIGRQRLLTGEEQAKSRLTNLNLTGLFRAC
jgi:hypothetical protein